MKDRLKKIRNSLTDSQGKKYTQTSFAKEMHISRDTLANYEIGRVEPTDIFINAICEKFRINEIWLRTGEGDMYDDVSRNVEIGNIVAKIISDENPFKNLLIKLISDLTDDQLNDVYKMAKSIVEVVEKDHD